MERVIDENENLAEFRSKQDMLIQEKEDLEAKLLDEVKKRNEEVTIKERQKIQATEKLRKEMLFKIKETKANLLALNDE